MEHLFYRLIPDFRTQPGTKFTHVRHVTTMVIFLRHFVYKSIATTDAPHMKNQNRPYCENFHKARVDVSR